MNLDDMTAAWRAEDFSPLFGVDKTLLHQALRQEQAKLEKRTRRMMWGAYVFGVTPLLISSGLFLAITLQPSDANKRVVWDYVVGVISVAAAITVAWTMFALRRSQKAREQGFGDSLRDHLRRRIAQLHDEAAVERRLALIAAAAGLICAWAIPIVQRRIAHVPVPYSDFYWSPLPIILIFAFIYLSSSKWVPSSQRAHLARVKRELEAMLKELDDQ